MMDESGRHVTDAIVAALGATLATTEVALVAWCVVVVSEIALYVLCELRSAGCL